MYSATDTNIIHSPPKRGFHFTKIASCACLGDRDEVLADVWYVRSTYVGGTYFYYLKNGSTVSIN